MNIPSEQVRRHPVYRDLETTLRTLLRLEEGPLTRRTVTLALDRISDAAHAAGYAQARADVDNARAERDAVEARLAMALDFLSGRVGAHSTQPAIYQESVDDLELSVRSSNCLDNAGIKTVGQLIALTEGDLLRLRYFGRKSLDEIKCALRERGLRLRGPT